jgi:hypothetical protein
MSLGVTAIEAQLCAAGVDSVIGAIGDKSIDGTSEEDIAYRIRYHTAAIVHIDSQCTILLCVALIIVLLVLHTCHRGTLLFIMLLYIMYSTCSARSAGALLIDTAQGLRCSCWQLCRTCC